MIDVALRHEPLPTPVIDEWFFAGEVCHGYVMLCHALYCQWLLFYAVLVRSCVQKDSEHFFTSNQIRTIAEAVRHASKALAKFFSVDAIPDVHEKCPTAQSRC